MTTMINRWSDIKEKYGVTLADPVAKNYYEDVENRVYWLDYDFVDEMADAPIDIIKLITKYNIEDIGLPYEERRPFIIYINSGGGDLFVCSSVIEAMQTSKTPIWTVNVCRACSAAAIILMAGHRRFGFKGSTVMVHRGSTFLGGETSVVESTQAYIKKLDKRVDEFMFAKTTINQKEYKKKASSDMYFDDNEALNNHIIDELVNDYEVFDR